jgi:hypothetical protein
MQRKTPAHGWDRTQCRSRKTCSVRRQLKPFLLSQGPHNEEVRLTEVIEYEVAKYEVIKHFRKVAAIMGFETGTRM